jgi:NAD(P)-dependent dehydrogenase (short-subunit alcohol dehydrogenase family)
MSDNRPLAGMTAIVTGGSGGIGSASAELLLRDGATVMIMARRADVLEETRAERHGRRARRPCRDVCWRRHGGG